MSLKLVCRTNKNFWFDSINAAAFGALHFEVSVIVHAITVGHSGNDDVDDHLVRKEGIGIMKGISKQPWKMVKEIIFGWSDIFPHEKNVQHLMGQK